MVRGGNWFESFTRNIASPLCVLAGLYCSAVETFLNLVWLSLSVFLVTVCVPSLRRRGSEFNLTTLVAITLLVVLLFPAISMTDDLMAMNSPAEVQQIMDRHELSLFHTVQAAFVSLLGAVPLMTPALSALAFLGIISARIWPFSFAARVLAGYARSLGIRGPSTFATL